jgi:hypothetical protein
MTAKEGSYKKGMGGHGHARPGAPPIVQKQEQKHPATIAPETCTTRSGDAFVSRSPGKHHEQPIFGPSPIRAPHSASVRSSRWLALNTHDRFKKEKHNAKTSELNTHGTKEK